MVDLQPGSPEWWVQRLDKKLRRRRPAVKRRQGYYDGDHDLKFASEKFKSAFGALFGELADNFCGLVIDAVEERLNIEGFRIGADSQQGDDAAWTIWQRNALDAESQIAHLEALIADESYVLVWADKSGLAEITVESPLEMVVDVEPGRRRSRRAAWKVWRDDFTGRLFGTLYLPSGIWKFQTPNPVQEGERLTADGDTRWIPREVAGEATPLPNPLKVVPVVPLRNRPRLLVPSVSEIKGVIPVQDAINKVVADFMVASEYQSFRQRWATGMEIPEDPETHAPIEPFKSAIDRLWVSESETTTFGEFGEVTLTNFIAGVEMLVQHVASQTRTPPHYFYLKGNLPSGESIKSAETGLVAKSRRKMRFFGEDWEEVVRLALLVESDPRSEDPESFAGETIWADPEYRSEGEHVDAVLKMKALGIPEEALWEELGFSPQQISRFRALKTQSALELAAAASTFPAPAVPTPPAGAPVMNGNTPAEMMAGS